MHISDDFVDSIFVAIYRVFETRRECAAGTLFFSVLLERNTLPLTGAWGGWVVGGLLDVAGCWVWIIGFDKHQLPSFEAHPPGVPKSETCFGLFTVSCWGWVVFCFAHCTLLSCSILYNLLGCGVWWLDIEPGT